MPGRRVLRGNTEKNLEEYCKREQQTTRNYIRLSPEVAQRYRAKLEARSITVQDWFRQHVDRELNNEHSKDTP